MKKCFYYAFLALVLVACGQSQEQKAFTSIPQIVNQNVQMVQRIFNIEQHQIETDEKIELILDKIEEIAPKQLQEQIFQTGCVWDAWSYVSDLVRSAKERIVLIDNFVDDRAGRLLRKTILKHTSAV